MPGRETKGPPIIEVPSEDADAAEPGETGEAQESPSRPGLPRRIGRGGPTTPRRSGDADDGTLDRLLSGLREI